MLHYFVHHTILDGEFSSLYKVKDIKNPKNEPASGSLKIKSSFEFIEKEVLLEMLKVIDLLNDGDYKGSTAKLQYDRQDESWQVAFYDRNSESIMLENEDGEEEILLLVTEVAIKISQDEFEIAKYTNNEWILSIDQGILQSSDKELWNDKDYQNKELKIAFEFNPYKEPKFISIEKEKGFLEKMNDIAFLEDIKASFQNQIENKKEPMPLLAYYGGASINPDIKYDTHFSLDTHSAYHNTLIPSRFSLGNFFHWFEEKQKIANEELKKETEKVFNSEGKLSDKAKQLEGIVKNFTELIDKFTDIDNPLEFPIIEEAQHLFIVKEAILQMLNDEEAGYSNIRIEYTNGFPEMLIHKKQGNASNDLNINQLSSGERNLLALVGDIAIRLIQLNPKVDNPLVQGRGIVLIDEIDLHLHPLWQRKVIPKLREIFPEIQFVVTTHSPLVLQNVKGKVWNIGLGETTETLLLSGLRIDEILEFMGLNPKQQLSMNYEKQLKEFELAYNSSDYKHAKEAFQELEKIIPAKDSTWLSLKTKLDSINPNEDWI
jgi:predicted ATP-binding protein involved in virulence